MVLRALKMLRGASVQHPQQGQDAPRLSRKLFIHLLQRLQLVEVGDVDPQPEAMLRMVPEILVASAKSLFRDVLRRFRAILSSQHSAFTSKLKEPSTSLQFIAKTSLPGSPESFRDRLLPYRSIEIKHHMKLRKACRTVCRTVCPEVWAQSSPSNLSASSSPPSLLWHSYLPIRPAASFLSAPPETISAPRLFQAGRA